MSDSIKDGEWKFHDAVGRSRNMLVPYYLMASYCYYVRDTPILEDHTFDQICKDLYKEWDQIKHVHKKFVDKEALIAGTCLLDEKAYPLMCVGAACDIAGIDPPKMKIEKPAPVGIESFFD